MPHSDSSAVARNDDAPSAPWKAGPRRGVRVLIVEDDPADTSLVLTALGDIRGVAEAEPFDAPEQALARLRSGEIRPDLILLDLHMPRMDGFEFLQRLRRSPTAAHIPVVFLTTSGLGREHVAAGLSSAFDYVIKPDSQRELRASLARVIHRLKHGPKAGVG